MPDPDSLESIADRKTEKDREKKAAERAGEPETQRLNVNIPKRLHAAVKSNAALEGRPMKKWVAEALEEKLNR